LFFQFAQASLAIICIGETPFDRESVRTPAIAHEQQKKAKAISSDLSLAEKEGFEPPVRLPGQRFSRPPHSTALPFLRAQKYNSFLICRISGKKNLSQTIIAINTVFYTLIKYSKKTCFIMFHILHLQYNTILYIKY
jgi:hypothetical protein